MNFLYKYILPVTCGFMIISGIYMAQAQAPSKRITIWIHGTRGTAIFPIKLSKKMTATERAFCYCPKGLHLATTIDPQLVHYKHAQLLAQKDPLQFPLDSFYIFGWSGDLSPQARYKAAQELYKELAKILETYRAQHKEPIHITLITHSHGGNVALNLARMPYNDIDLTIDRLVILACPIQKETEPLSKAPLFKKIYSLYSHADFIQIGDPQKVHPFGCIVHELFKQKSWEPLKKAFKESWNRPFFSERCFTHAPHIIQAPLKWKDTAPWSSHDFEAFLELKHVMQNIASWLDRYKNRGLLHVEFILPMFVQQLPTVLAQADKKPNKPIEL